MFKTILYLILSCWVCIPLSLTAIPINLSSGVLQQYAVQDTTNWDEASFEVLSESYALFQTADLGHPYFHRNNCIVRVAPEIEGLTGVKIPMNKFLSEQTQHLEIRFNEPAKLLVGIFREKGTKYIDVTDLPSQTSPMQVLKNGLTLTGLPPVDIYALEFSQGKQVIDFGKKGLFVILGVVIANQELNIRNANKPDGRAWDTFVVEGFSDEPALFDIVGGKDQPVLDKGMPGTEGNRGGFEGGRLVKIGNTYHMFPTERVGEEGVGSYHDRVKTRIAHWTSKDAVHWTRQATLYESSGVYAVTDNDNPANDRRSALWSFMPTYSKKLDRWLATYVAYTTHREINPNHSFGRIWQARSVQKGKEGIGGPYEDIGIILEPGLNSQLWEGRQGVQSFFPFKVSDHWLAFFGGGYPWESWEDYPYNGGKGWYVGLARADQLRGPWIRMDTTINPITSMHPWFIENPIVTQLPNDVYIAIFDGGPDGWGLHLPNMFGYSLSIDGIHWTKAHYFPIRTKVNKWWDIMRTPMGLIPEGNGIYTVVYAAIDNEKRFHPIGMVKLQLNKDVLRERTTQMRQNKN